MDLLDLSWLSPSYWLADAREPISHPVYAVLAVLLALGLGAAVYVRLAVDAMFAGHRLKQRHARMLTTPAIWLCATGLVLLLFRWQPVPLLSKPLWWYLWCLAFIAAVAYAGYFYRRLYPQRLAEHEHSERVRRYLPRAVTGPAKARRKTRRRR
jgi:hypothetical protein